MVIIIDLEDLISITDYYFVEDFDLTGFADDTILVKLSNLIEILSNLRE